MKNFGALVQGVRNPGCGWRRGKTAIGGADSLPSAGVCFSGEFLILFIGIFKKMLFFCCLLKGLLVIIYC